MAPAKKPQVRQRKPEPKPMTEEWFAARDRADAKSRADRKNYYR